MKKILLLTILALSNITSHLNSCPPDYSACADAPDPQQCVEEMQGYYQKIDWNKSIFDSILSGNHTGIEDALKNGVDINGIMKKGHYPLHYAIAKNNLTIVDFLISKGAKLDLCDKYDHTPIYEAVLVNNTEIVTLLIERGANPKLDCGKNSPLEKARENKLTEIVLLLKFADSIVK